MPLTAVGLVLFAALCHTTWNLLLKRRSDRLAAQSTALLAAVVCTTPILLVYSPGDLPPAGWALALASALFETGYVFALSAAYGVGDLSLVYPVARGSATGFVVPLAVALLGERPSPSGLLGLVLVLAGVFGGEPGLCERAPAASGRRRALALALLTGTMIAGYSLVNKVGVGLAAVPLFAYVVFALNVALVFGIARIRGRAVPLAARARWPEAALMGGLMIAAYLAVLTAMSLAPVSYVVAAREIGVVVAALLGWLVLGEPHSPRRLFAAAVIFSGLVVIALSR